MLYLVAMVTNKYNMREVLSVGSCDTVDTSHNYLFMALPVMICMVQRMICFKCVLFQCMSCISISCDVTISCMQHLQLSTRTFSTIES